MNITVNPAQEQAPQDIFKPGSLVKSNDWVILVTEGVPYNDSSFCGVVLDSNTPIYRKWDTAWDKGCFVKFVGSVLLEQE